MPASHLTVLIDRLRNSVGAPQSAGLSDAALLDRYVRTDDQAAFEVLVWRHGPLVWKVCKRIVRHEQDAQDAFQATFLVLAQKAASIMRRPVLAGWLYRVAYRVALEAKQVAARRAAREKPKMDCEHIQPESNGENLDLLHLLDEEVNRLPEKYRVAVVLCYLQGKTHEEAG